MNEWLNATRSLFSDVRSLRWFAYVTTATTGASLVWAAFSGWKPMLDTLLTWVQRPLFNVALAVLVVAVLALLLGMAVLSVRMQLVASVAERERENRRSESAQSALALEVRGVAESLAQALAIQDMAAGLDAFVSDAQVSFEHCSKTFFDAADPAAADHANNCAHRASGMRLAIPFVFAGPGTEPLDELRRRRSREEIEAMLPAPNESDLQFVLRLRYREAWHWHQALQHAVPRVRMALLERHRAVMATFAARG